MAAIITLISDFGNADGYQGVLEGILYGINPEAHIAIISHKVPPGDIIGGWYLLKTHHKYFPAGTVHLAVVDPGVGTERKIVAVRTEKYIFVAPDNGLLSFISNEEVVSINAISNPDYMLGEISPVFHGRDIMAPAAAFLSRGIDPDCFGKKLKAIKRIMIPQPFRKTGKTFGHVIWVDHFGNLITNITDIESDAIVMVNGREAGRIHRTFSDVGSGQTLAYIGSGGHLEIALRDGSAYDYFGGGQREDFEIVVAPEK